MVIVLTISTTSTIQTPPKAAAAPIDLGQTSDGGGRGFHTSDDATVGGNLTRGNP